MGDTISISGGAGGVKADYQAMRHGASAMKHSAGELVHLAGDLTHAALNPDLAEAAILCPLEVAELEGALSAGAATAMAVAGEFEALALLVGGAADALEATDAAVAKAAEMAWDVASWTAGAVAVAAVPVAIAAGVDAAAGWAVTHPADAWKFATDAEARDKMLGELKTNAVNTITETLYDNPWLQEALTRMAPGMVQGAGFTLAGLFGPAGTALLTSMSDGNWPTGNYQQAIQGLIAIGNTFGAFNDGGDFSVQKLSHDARLDADVGTNQSNFLQTLINQERNLQSQDGQVRIITVDNGSGQPAYIVQVPGTQDWSPSRGGNPVDLTTNVQLMAGNSTLMQQKVLEAMKLAHIPASAPVMLMGHSQGGITAASMASDPAVLAAYNVKSVVTAGSPIARFPIPDSVSVMSIENSQDIVPKLDGLNNPDSPNWVTVRADLDRAKSDADGSGTVDVADAHSMKNYSRVAAMADQSTDESIAAWQQQNSDFFGTQHSERYQIEGHK